MNDLKNENKIPFHEMSWEEQEMLRALHCDGQVEQFCMMTQSWIEPMETLSKNWWSGIYRMKQGD
jgi:hypothetical protein